LCPAAALRLQFLAFSKLFYSLEFSFNSIVAIDMLTAPVAKAKVAASQSRSLSASVAQFTLNQANSRECAPFLAKHDHVI